MHFTRSKARKQSNLRFLTNKRKGPIKILIFFPIWINVISIKYTWYTSHMMSLSPESMIQGMKFLKMASKVVKKLPL